MGNHPWCRDFPVRVPREGLDDAAGVAEAHHVIYLNVRRLQTWSAVVSPVLRRAEMPPMLVAYPGCVYK